jgi:hypothetical protein
MALNFLLGTDNFITTHDSYAPPHRLDTKNGCRVVFTCLRKNMELVAMLSEGFSISVGSEWKSLFGGAIGNDIGAKFIDILDNVAQISGASIRQPYFGRKYWAGTTPLSFSLSFQFVAFSNAKEEVYDPMISLMSLLYPRISDEGKSTATMLETYFIPGPNLFYDVTKGDTASDKGDRVSIKLGSFLKFDGCYITKCSFNVENSFSTTGYPNCIKATVTFETMDVAFVANDGTFMDKGFGDASVELGEGLKFIKDLTNKAGNAVANVGKKGGENIEGFFNNVMSKIKP